MLETDGFYWEPRWFYYPMSHFSNQLSRLLCFSKNNKIKYKNHFQYEYLKQTQKSMNIFVDHSRVLSTLVCHVKCSHRNFNLFQVSSEIKKWIKYKTVEYNSIKSDYCVFGNWRKPFNLNNKKILRFRYEKIYRIYRSAALNKKVL